LITIYEATETSFDTLGLGALMPSTCKIAESLNGQYELDMIHPIDAEGKWEKLANGRIIKASTHDGEQLFRIYDTRKDPISGQIVVNARHIFYDLLDNLMEDTRPTVKTGQEAGEIILAGCQYATPFTFLSDIEDVSSAYYIRVNPVQAFIGNIDQSFINRWGGEIRRNNFEISINTRRGSDKGVRIAYGKNLTGIDVTEDISGVYTRLMPIATDENNVVFYTDAKYYDSPLINNYPHPKIGILNTGIRVGQEINGEVPYPDAATAKAAMAEMAEAAFEAGVDKPKITINISFIQWQDTDQYKPFKALYSLDLGDDVTVDYAPLNLTYKLRVISIVWDAINNRVESMTLGDKTPNIAKTVADMDINLSALRNDIAGALQENERYNGVYINHEDGFVTEAVIGGKTIRTKQNSYDGFAIYDGSKFIGGVRPLGDSVALVSNVLTNDIDGDCYATIGTFVKDGVAYKGIFIFDKSVSTTTPRCRITIWAGNVNFFDGNGTLRIKFGLSGENDMHLYDSNGVSRFSCMNDTTMISVGHNPYGTVFDANSEMVQLSAPYAIQHRLGVDANGPYYVKNMNKVYF
jgi:phage minor structural protein